MIKKEVFIGFVVGLLATAMGFYFYVEYVLEGSFLEALLVITENGLYGQVLSIAALLNLASFFIFIKKKQDYRARGVLLSTILIAILVLLSQFM